MYNSDTIAAIATAVSPSGISIVRVSGPDSIQIADRIFRPFKGNKKPGEYDSHTIHYGYIMDGEQVVDEVLLMLMKAPNTYTREDTIEINCHGGVYVTRRVLETVIKYGARPAEPGEYTKRAFLNGRIDLSQAESVIDVINSKNEYALKSSVSQLRGSVVHSVKELRATILHEIAFIESALDDPEHISLDGYPQLLNNIVDNLVDEIGRLLASSDNGRILKEGINTVILGKPNAGKSSLLNALLGENRAIVTDIAGTTRDVIEEQINIHGVTLNIMDTAGIRNTEDIVEKIGVDKALEIADKADLILYVMDSSTEPDENDHQIVDMIRGRKAIVLMNKSDLNCIINKEEIEKQTGHTVIETSMKNNTGIDELETLIKDMFFGGEINFNDEIYITNARQKKALQDAYESLNMAKQSIINEMPEDFFSIDLMSAYESLGLIIGESLEDDLADEIFSKFCMGK